MKTRYAVEAFGCPIEGIFYDKTVAFEAARDFVDQYICDHFRHNLPLNVKSEKRFEPDINVYAIKDTVKLPLQKWVDEYYEDQKTHIEETEKRERARYLELKEKYENN